ncbi:MAG TPA: TetR/AcrR family transcriptional regulator [Polyangia bacterium]|jgi:AcrR family transcriptional regulator
MPAGRPRAYLGREKKILDAALRVFATRGVVDTTVADVAKAGDVGVGAVYRYFGNREELFRKVVRRAAERVGEVVRAEVAEAATTIDEYEHQLHRIGDRLAAVVDAEPQLVRFLLDEARGFDSEVDRQLDELFELFAGFTEGYLANGKDRGYLRADLDVTVTARLVNAMIMEAVRRLAHKSTTRERHKWMYGLIRLMLNGARAR